MSTPSEMSGGSGLSKSRVETLCDGVLAIAMTLMIFNIRVPEIPHEQAANRLGGELFRLWPRFLVYGISFVMLGVYWVGHHNQFHYIRRTDRMLLWINIAFLLFVTLIPFSTDLIGQYPTQRLTVDVYAITLLLVGISLYMHWWYATSNHRLVDPDIDPRLVRLAKQRILTAPAILVVAIATSFFSAKLSLVLCAMVPVVYIVPGRIDRVWAAPRHRHESNST
jgi:TMEM175 potassium channel family protein